MAPEKNNHNTSECTTISYKVAGRWVSIDPAGVERYEATGERARLSERASKRARSGFIWRNFNSSRNAFMPNIEMSTYAKR